MQQAAKAVICVTTGLLRHNDLDSRCCCCGASFCDAFVRIYVFKSGTEVYRGCTHVLLQGLFLVLCVCFIDMPISRIYRRVFRITVFPFYKSSLSRCFVLLFAFYEFEQSNLENTERSMLIGLRGVVPMV